MDKAISTALLTVAGIIAMLAVFNAVLPAINRTSGAVITASGVVDERIQTDISIVHATGKSGAATAYVWVKNVGAANVEAIDKLDVFFGPQGDFQRIPQGSVGCTAPCWEYTLENDTKFKPMATLRLTLKLETNLAGNTTYYSKVVTANGVTDARYFTVA